MPRLLALAGNADAAPLPVSGAAREEILSQSLLMAVVLPISRQLDDPPFPTFPGDSRLSFSKFLYSWVRVFCVNLCSIYYCYCDFGSYMEAKNRKLRDQFDADASTSSLESKNGESRHSDTSGDKGIFHGVSIFVDGYTIPSNQARLSGFGDSNFALFTYVFLLVESRLHRFSRNLECVCLSMADGMKITSRGKQSRI